MPQPSRRYVELDTTLLWQRFFATLPGLLSWGTLIGLTVLAFLLPFWVAIFIIAYDVYVLVRAFYMSVHLVFAYTRLKKMKDIDWLSRCRQTASDLSWEAVHHIIIFPTYQESLTVLRASLQALAQSQYPHERLHVVVGFE